MRNIVSLLFILLIGWLLFGGLFYYSPEKSYLGVPGAACAVGGWASACLLVIFFGHLFLREWNE